MVNTADTFAKRLVVRAVDGSTGIMGMITPPFASEMATDLGPVDLVRVAPHYVLYAERVVDGVA